MDEGGDDCISSISVDVEALLLLLLLLLRKKLHPEPVELPPIMLTLYETDEISAMQCNEVSYESKNTSIEMSCHLHVDWTLATPNACPNNVRVPVKEWRLSCVQPSDSD